MATKGLALALRITGGLAGAFIQSSNRASQQLVGLKERAAQLSAELGKEQAALRAAARGTQEYADAQARVKTLKTQLSGISQEIVSTNVESRKASASIAGMKKQLGQAAAIAAVGSVAFAGAAAATIKTAQAYTDLRISASSAGLQVDALAADIRANTAALNGNADRARAASQGSLDYYKNLQLLTVGLGNVDAAMAHVAGIDPFAQARMSYDEVRASNVAAIRSALALADAQERARRLGAIEQVIGTDQYAALFQYASLTDEQRARVDDLRKRQSEVTRTGAAGWGSVGFAVGQLRGEMGLLYEVASGPLTGSFSTLFELAASGVRWFSDLSMQNETLGRWMGYAAIAGGGLAAGLTALIGLSAIYRGALFALTGATQAGAAWEAIRTGVIWRSTAAITGNTVAVSRNVVAWLVSRGIMVAGANATGVMTAAQWALNVALTANPIGIVVVAIGALIGGLVLLYAKSERFRNIIRAAWEMLKKFWPILLGPIGFAIKGFQTLYQRSEKFRNILQRIWETAKKVGSALSKIPGLGGGGDDDAAPGAGGGQAPGRPGEPPQLTYPDVAGIRPPQAGAPELRYPDVAGIRPPQQGAPELRYPDVAGIRPPQAGAPQLTYPDVDRLGQPTNPSPVARPEPVQYPRLDNRGQPLATATAAPATGAAGGDNISNRSSVTEINNTFHISGVANPMEAAAEVVRMQEEAVATAAV